MKLDKIFCFFELSRSCKIYLKHENRSKENADGRKIWYFDMLQKGDSVIVVARDIGVSREVGSVITSRDDAEEEVVF